VPALYAGTETATDNALKLGRATDWRGNEGEPVRGIGQRTFLIGEEDRPVMELAEITFASS
jgi:type VI secretion system protein ImpE